MTLMKGQKEFSSKSFPRADMAINVQSVAEARGSKELKIHFLGTWVFLPKETEVISPKTTVFSVCDALEIACVPLVGLCLISLLLTSSYFMNVSTGSASFPLGNR